MTLLGRWQLPPLHLDIVRKYLRLGDLTLPLDAPSFGRTAEEFSRLGLAELERMQANGIVVDDEVEPRLAEALKVLTTPYLWVDSLWFPQAGDDHTWRAVAAATEGDRVVLGVQTPSENPRYGGLLTVEVHEKVPLSQVLLPTLPPAPPGNRGAVRVPASSLRPALQAEDFGEGGLLQSATPTQGSSGDRQVTLYKAIGKSEHVRIGQIAANLRDRYGRVKRSDVLRWFDNVQPDGRYLDHSERGNTGEQMYMLSPADARLIRTHVDTLIAQVR